MAQVTTVNTLLAQLKLAKNKDAKIVFKSGKHLLNLELLAEVVEEKGDVRYPALGENTNAVVLKLSDIVAIPKSE